MHDLAVGNCAMPPDAPEPPWMSAWRATQAELAQFTGGGAAADPIQLAIRGMQDVGSDHAALAADLWRRAVTGDSGLAPGPVAELAGRYRHLLMPGAASHPSAGAVPERLQRASAAMLRQAQAIAADAQRRLVDALAEKGPAATPVTTLRELFELWVECGEAAWASAAHHDDFAADQAEWLAALVESGRGPSPR